MRFQERKTAKQGDTNLYQGVLFPFNDTES